MKHKNIIDNNNFGCLLLSDSGEQSAISIQDILNSIKNTINLGNMYVTDETDFGPLFTDGPGLVVMINDRSGTHTKVYLVWCGKGEEMHTNYYDIRDDRCKIVPNFDLSSIDHLSSVDVSFKYSAHIKDDNKINMKVTLVTVMVYLHGVRNPVDLSILRK